MHSNLIEPNKFGFHSKLQSPQPASTLQLAQTRNYARKSCLELPFNFVSPLLFVLQTFVTPNDCRKSCHLQLSIDNFVKFLELDVSCWVHTEMGQQKVTDTWHLKDHTSVKAEDTEPVPHSPLNFLSAMGSLVSFPQRSLFANTMYPLLW